MIFNQKHIVFILIFITSQAFAQMDIPPKKVEIFKERFINFGGKSGDTSTVKRLQNGRLIYRKVDVPKFKNGTDVSIKLTLKSNGDPWDKSGSCFVVTNPELIDIIDVSKGAESFEKESGVGEELGIIRTNNYYPAIELLRFMTPFGVGHFSDEEKVPKIKYSRPVYIPKWEEAVVWEKDISDLASLVTGDFYIGIWIDTWTAEGYVVDLELEYSGRPRPTPKVMPLFNTVYYVEGQKIPELFVNSSLNANFKVASKLKNVKLHYTTTGHGGHSGGDEFIKINNEVYYDSEKVLSEIPWRDDCASFRRFNPSSGVWTKKDSAYVYNEQWKKELKVIEERLASSDLSRSNWCPGSMVKPFVVDLGDIKKGEHTISVKIPATKNEEGQTNHWLVSGYLTYQE